MKILFAAKHQLALCILLFKQSLLFRAVVITGGVLIVLIGVFGVFFSSVSTNFAFGGNSCTKTLIALPNLQKISKANDFNIEPKGVVRVAGYSLLAQELCVSPKAAPVQNTKASVSLHLFGTPLLSKTIRVATPNYPTINTDFTALHTISVADPLLLQLSTADTTFDYVLTANGKQSICQKQSALLSCNPQPLGLQHVTAYDFALIRVFGQKPVQTITTAKITTVTPLLIQSTSIANGSVRYDSPKIITITTDKPITSVKDISLVQRDTNNQIAIKATYATNVLTITIEKELARGQDYALNINNILAKDGESLTKPYSINFSVSKGPKVSGATIGGSGVLLAQNIGIQFDQPINQSQNLAAEVSLVIAGKPVTFTAIPSEQTITINPSDVLPKCTKFTVTVTQNISNPYGIAGESAWSYTSRTTCFETISIGTSVQGRQITAYRFGSGTNPLLFVGGIHGDEQNAKRLMDKWVSEIDSNPEKVPVNRTIIIIPSANPDGYAKNQRVNAHGIDLNRNFPANNWKAAVKEPSGATLPEGGGATALSEPESSVLVNYVQSLQPKFVMSYHSSGGVAVANDAGVSNTIAELYAQKSGYGARNGATIGNFFDYDTTGAFEDWLYDKQGIGAVLVELYSKYDDEFSQNKNALWAVTQSVSF